ncbi:MAG: sugar ABC transporter permease, partial [Thermoplasmata archaeon]
PELKSIAGLTPVLVLFIVDDVSGLSVQTPPRFQYRHTNGTWMPAYYYYNMTTYKFEYYAPRTSTGFSFNFTGLADEVTYHVSVVAVNNMGEKSSLPAAVAGSTSFKPTESAEQNRAPIYTAISVIIVAYVLVALFFIYKNRKEAPAYLYIAPALLALMILTFYPVSYGFYLSITNRKGFVAKDVSIVGISNYIEVFKDTQFYSVLLTTLIWTIACVAIHVLVGLLLAILLNRKLKGRTVIRTVLLLPWAIPNYISVLIWKGIFDYNSGLANRTLDFLGIDRVNWLGGIITTIPLPLIGDYPIAWGLLVVIAVNGWLGFSFMMMTFSGGLQSIPEDIYEAAEIDGATPWQQFRHITLPLLKPTVIPATILGFIWTFNMFNVIYLLTGGGPAGATDILITKVYREAFINFKFGLSAAWSVVIFFIILIISQGFNKLTKGMDDSEGGSASKPKTNKKEKKKAPEKKDLENSTKKKEGGEA